MKKKCLGLLLVAALLVPNVSSVLAAPVSEEAVFTNGVSDEDVFVYSEESMTEE